jgi:hypothetical protein
MVPLMDQYEEHVLRASDVVQEELHPNLQVPPHQVNGRGREGFVEGDLVDVFEKFRDSF